MFIYLFISSILISLMFFSPWHGESIFRNMRCGFIVCISLYFWEGAWLSEISSKVHIFVPYNSLVWQYLPQVGASKYKDKYQIQDKLVDTRNFDRNQHNRMQPLSTSQTWKKRTPWTPPNLLIFPPNLDPWTCKLDKLKKCHLHSL